ncbi:MAG: c-type cytochrome [Alphaproteobacteria bacterium]|nr:c-type cytochrome [Alphaproteobacteria bacterium]MDP6814354.1 c-type cytochrome [Alphaproteobacteria bacterium]
MHGRRSLARGLAACLLLAGPATAKATEDPAETLYRDKTCIACHGPKGVEARLVFPSLAGQNKTYIYNQTRDIIGGKRLGSPDGSGRPATAGMREALVAPNGEVRISDGEIRRIAAWLERLPPAQPSNRQAVDPTAVEAGRKAYKKRKCQICHGRDGRRPLKRYPFIAGQKKAYLVRQMTDIKAKIRTNGKTGVMRASIRQTTAAEIEAIAAYLSRIDRSGN